MMRRLFRFSAVLLLLVIASIAGMYLSAPYRHKRELQQKLPLFEKIVADMQGTGNPVPGALVSMPVSDDAKDSIRSLLAQRGVDGSLAVEFIMDSGFPVKHRGFLYLSSGNPAERPEITSRWPQRSPVSPNWWRIGD